MAQRGNSEIAVYNAGVDSSEVMRLLRVDERQRWEFVIPARAGIQKA